MTPSLEAFRSAEDDLWAALGARPRERVVELSPTQRVRVQVLGDGPPALFIHGAMTGGSAFAPLAVRLTGLRCVLVDRPGCGLSDPWTLKDEFREQVVELTGRLLDALELPSVTLVGNSLGALWCTWFSLAHPERVHRLVLLGPSIGFAGVRPPAFMRLLALPGLGALIKRKMASPTPATMRRVFRELGHGKSLVAGKIPEVLLEWGLRMSADTSTQANDLHAVQRLVGLGGARPWAQLGEEALGELRMPTLLIAGADDAHGGPALAERIGRCLAAPTVQPLRDAGHLPWLDDPAAVADAVTRFLS